MSKSLNNFFTIREVLAQYDAEVVRYFLLASQYRSQINYATELLDQTKNTLERLYTVLRGIPQTEISESEFAQNPYKIKFDEAMNDDFNTPVALAEIFQLAHHVNVLREKNDPQSVKQAAVLKRLGNILGLLERNPEEFLQGKQDNTSEIEQLIAQREQARVEKNWSKADEIRQQLLSMGIVLEDTPQGTIWRQA